MQRWVCCMFDSLNVLMRSWLLGPLSGHPQGFESMLFAFFSSPHDLVVMGILLAVIGGVLVDRIRGSSGPRLPSACQEVGELRAS